MPKERNTLLVLYVVAVASTLAGCSVSDEENIISVISYEDPVITYGYGEFDVEYVEPLGSPELQELSWHSWEGDMSCVLHGPEFNRQYDYYDNDSLGTDVLVKGNIKNEIRSISLNVGDKYVFEFNGKYSTEITDGKHRIDLNNVEGILAYQEENFSNNAMSTNKAVLRQGSIICDTM